MATLNLPTSPQTSVFRAIDKILRQDLTLRTLFGDNFISWQGDPQDSREMTKTMAPAIRITPVVGPDTWKFPESFAGELFIAYELIIDGFDIDDLFNVVWAVKRAIYPTVDATKLAINQTLQNAGALSGLVEFNNPGFDPKPADNFFYVNGQMKITCRSQIT